MSSVYVVIELLYPNKYRNKQTLHWNLCVLLTYIILVLRIVKLYVYNYNTELFLMCHFHLADEAKRNGIGLLHDVSQQGGLLGTRQTKLNAKKLTRKKVMDFLK
jgi:hypothetical protein